MVNSESRQYVISGEVPLDDWTLALQMLGRLGLSAQALTDRPGEPSQDEQLANLGLELLPAGTIPYTLAGITSPGQYVASEHLGEFWPEYRASLDRRVVKHEALGWGVGMLCHPSPKPSVRNGINWTTEQRDTYAAELGLVVVRPRSLVGFSDEYGPGVYGLWNHEKYGDAVVQAGSFITTVQAMRTMPANRLPTGITHTTLTFFNAFADKLLTQIEAE